jgi:hypothetical protein
LAVLPGVFSTGEHPEVAVGIAHNPLLRTARQVSNLANILKRLWS